MRSRYTVPGARIPRLTVDVAPADRLRPSVGTISALRARYEAETSAPGMLWYVPDTWMFHGSLYDPRNFTCVRYGVATRQYGIVSGLDSGTCANTAQASVTVVPVLTPPWKSAPFASLAFIDRSTPCQYSVCLPNWSVPVRTFW